ncbi:hypothetical protein SEA_MAGRITTE_153 [Microbacterium phage Magritte]|nr:hypothetical protein SEA_MAGRITTE_153 [Microbacterium phage Magritte]
MSPDTEQAVVRTAQRIIRWWNTPPTTPPPFPPGGHIIPARFGG